MYRKCTTERSAQNQRALENAFLALMGKLPYEQITITQICGEAGISRRIFIICLEVNRTRCMG